MRRWKGRGKVGEVWGHQIPTASNPHVEVMRFGLCPAVETYWCLLIGNLLQTSVITKSSSVMCGCDERILLR
jgi:hypothetical protein